MIWPNERLPGTKNTEFPRLCGQGVWITHFYFLTHCTHASDWHMWVFRKLWINKSVEVFLHLLNESGWKVWSRRRQQVGEGSLAHTQRLEPRVILQLRQGWSGLDGMASSVGIQILPFPGCVTRRSFPVERQFPHLQNGGVMTSTSLNFMETKVWQCAPVHQKCGGKRMEYCTSKICRRLRQ